jgi:hypothetical protein
VTREGEGVRLVDRHDGPFDLVDQATEVAPPFGVIDELAAHLGEKLAVVSDFDFRQSVDVGGDEVGELQHELAT